MFDKITGVFFKFLILAAAVSWFACFVAMVVGVVYGVGSLF